tara:strand:- start:303 stop:512 length:210 start_codon:yes stop_codon:yes gene_type:complete
MSKHDGNIEYTRENYREELKFDKKVKQTCERCDNYSLILTRPFYEVEGNKVLPRDASWFCSPCHKVRSV